MKPLSDASLAERLSAMPSSWAVNSGYLQRVIKTADFKSSLLLANAIGHVAESVWHHPDIDISWGRVCVRLTTHEAGGLTDRDFEMARLIEAQIKLCPGVGSILAGTPKDDRWQYLADE